MNFREGNGKSFVFKWFGGTAAALVAAVLVGKHAEQL